MTEVLLIILTASLVLSIVVGVLLVKSARDRASDISVVYEDAIDRLVEAERDKTRTANELESFKQLVAVFQSRPLIATLSDQQAQQLIQTVVSLIGSANNNPNQMN